MGMYDSMTVTLDSLHQRHRNFELLTPTLESQWQAWSGNSGVIALMLATRRWAPYPKRLVLGGLRPTAPDMPPRPMADVVDVSNAWPAVSVSGTDNRQY